jgi:hypothetical protein
VLSTAAIDRVLPSVEGAGAQAREKRRIELRRRALAEQAEARDTMTSIIATKDSLLSAQAVILDALQSNSKRLMTRVALRADSMRLYVKATPVQRANEPARTALEDTQIFKVGRQFREFISTGIMFSTIDSHDYQRTNRVISITSGEGDAQVTKDTVVSTFVDRSDAGQTAFAPVALANVGFSPWALADIGASTGVAVRSVSGKLAPEYLLGLTFVFADRLTINPMLHWGRVEELTLGDEDDVIDKGYPDTITHDSATRLKTERAFAVVVGLRL